MSIYRGTLVDMQGSIIADYESDNYRSLRHILRNAGIDLIIHKTDTYKWLITAYGLHYGHGYVTFNDALIRAMEDNDNGKN